MATLADIRAKLPNLEGTSDDYAFKRIHEDFFPDLDKYDLAKRLSYDLPLQTDTTGDTLKAVGEGALRTIGNAPSLIDIPLAAMGVEDRPAASSFEALGKDIGFTPTKWAEATPYSEAQRVADANVEAAWDDPGAGALDVAGAYAGNLRHTAKAMLTSIVPMVTYGLAGRAMGAAAGVGSKALAGAGGEGVGIAADTMAAIDPAVDPKTAALAATGAGVGGMALGVAAAGAARRLAGASDIDTLIAGGAANAAGETGLLNRTFVGGASESAEEGAQSATQQVAQNLAEGKPAGEGVAKQTVEGMTAAAPFGVGANLLPTAEPEATPKPRANKADIGPVLNAGSVDEAIAAANAVAGTGQPAPRQEQRAQPRATTFKVPPNIRDIITQAADRHGVSADTLLQIADIESKFDPAAHNPSGASGLFQFMPATARQYGLANPFDATASADAAARLAKDNAAYLFRKLGRAPSVGELYLAHQQGAGGAAKLLANPGALAKDVVGLQAVIQNGGRADMTAGEFANLWVGKAGGAKTIEAAAMPYVTPDLANAPTDSGDLVKDTALVAEEPSTGASDAQDTQTAPGTGQPAAPGQTETDLAGPGLQPGTPATGPALPVAPTATALDSRPLNAGIDSKAHEAATSPHNDLPPPTTAQIEAGNYKKGHVTVQGLDISIENPKGSERSGTDSDGKPWSVTMQNHYGYIKRTTGADGEQVDVFLGDNPASDKVFAVQQVDPKTKKFDEYKVMLGFGTEDEARAAYRANYGKGWQGMGHVYALTMSEFKTGLAEGDFDKPLKNKGITPQAQDQAAAAPAEGVSGPVAADVSHETKAEAKPDLVEYTTKRGKTLRGIVRTDLSKAEAQAIDPYTFTHNGGWFIREKHLGQSGVTSQDKAEKTQRQGHVGIKLSPNESVLTSSGRQTTPFPDFNKRGGYAEADQWLMQNAHDEATARGDEFNSRIFKDDIGRKNVPQASKDAAEEYLFGEQPKVVPPILKPLETQVETKTEPADVDKTAKTEQVAPDLSPKPENIDTKTDKTDKTETQPKKPAELTLPELEAMLADTRAKLDGQGQFQDDRLVAKARNLEEAIKGLREEQDLHPVNVVVKAGGKVVAEYNTGTELTALRAKRQALENFKDCIHGH